MVNTILGKIIIAKAEKNSEGDLFCFHNECFLIIVSMEYLSQTTRPYPG